MGFVSRDQNGKVAGWARNRNDQQQEELADEHPDVITYFTRSIERMGRFDYEEPQIPGHLAALRDLPDDGRAFPHHLAEILVQEYRHNDFTQEVIAAHAAVTELDARALIETAYQASLGVEEGRPVRFQILANNLESIVTSRFQAPIRLSTRALIKLAPTSNLDQRYLVVTNVDGALHIVGFCDPGLGQLTAPPVGSLVTSDGDVMPASLLGLKLSALGPGTVRARLLDFSVLLHQGVIRYDVEPHDVRPVFEWYRNVATADATSPTLAGHSQLDVDGPCRFVPNEVKLQAARRLLQQQRFRIFKHTWSAVLARVVAAAHGGCLVVLPAGVDVDQTPVRVTNYRVDSDSLRQLLDHRMSLEPHVSKHLPQRDLPDWLALANVPSVQHLLERTADIVAGFTAVDGAVLLNHNLRVFGFGAELTANPNTAHPTQINDFVHPSGDPVRRTLTDVGMRHRSAAYYCAEVPGSLAFVVSQDGAISVLAHTETGVARFGVNVLTS